MLSTFDSNQEHMNYKFIESMIVACRYIFPFKEFLNGYLFHMKDSFSAT